MYDAADARWISFNDPVIVISAMTTGEVAPALAQVENEIAAGRYLAGFIAYEAAPAFDIALPVKPGDGFPLLWFASFDRGETLSFPAGQAARPLDWRVSIDTDTYHQALQRIKEYIRQGDTYQVNYTYRMQTQLDEDPWQLFTRMIQAQGYGYGAFIDTGQWCICSASHELFFQYTGGVLTSRPMKGTVRRGMYSADDTGQADWLRNSAKNRAENLMIVDMVRNDMGRIADTGSVETVSLFDIEKYPTLWQMTSTVQARTSRPVSDILGALFPAASITGAPKKRTMEIIHELETAPRRIYTGTTGMIKPDGSAQFNVAIRTVLVDKTTGSAEYGVGGGIVWDSDAADELQECHTKARILTHVQPGFELLETMLWHPGDGIKLFELHMQRLAASAAYFGWDIEPDRIRQQLMAAVPASESSPQRVRLLVNPAGDSTITVTPVTPADNTNYRVHLAATPVDSGNPFLYHKTSQRGMYEHHLNSFLDYDDVLLFNEKGEVTETCIANVIFEVDGESCTPPVTCGLLGGTYRQYLLEQGRLRERVITVDEIRELTYIKLVNSVRGEWQASLLF